MRRSFMAAIAVRRRSTDVRGRIVICHGTHRQGLPSAAEREAALRAAGAAGMMTIADPGFTVEPPRWPYAYARTVTLAGPKLATRDPFLKLTLNAQSLGKLLAGTRPQCRRTDRRRQRRSSAAELRIPEPVARRFHAPAAQYLLAQRARHDARHRSEARRPGDRPVRAPRRLRLRRAGQRRPALQRDARRCRLCRAADPACRTAARRIPIADRSCSLHGPARKRACSARAGSSPIRRCRCRASPPTSTSTSCGRFSRSKLLTVHALDDTSLGDDARAVAQASESPCRTIRSPSAICSAVGSMAVPAGRHPGDGVRVRLPARLAQRADLPAMVPDRLPQAAGRPEAADGLEGRRRFQSLLLQACRARRGPTKRARVESREAASSTRSAADISGG